MRFREILRALGAADVEFIVIGGVGAVLQGAPLQTRDLDIVHGRGRENRRKLVEVLAQIGACYRDSLPERFAPDMEGLASPLHHLLSTRLGDLDLLGTVSGLDHDDLLPRSLVLGLEDGVRIRVLTLKGIIELKEMAGRAKDLAHLPILRQTLEEQRKRDSQGPR
jgi:hypothetical protein